MYNRNNDFINKLPKENDINNIKNINNINKSSRTSDFIEYMNRYIVDNYSKLDEYTYKLEILKTKSDDALSKYKRSNI